MSTIRDVALLAGVSAATVSRVLNGDTTYKITDDTKERVWQAVAKLGYQLPANPRQRAKKNTALEGELKIGCIISTTLKQFIDPFFVTILSSIEQRLKEKGCVLALVITGLELRNMFAEGNDFIGKLDGMILMDSLDEEIYRLLREKVKYLVGIDTVHKEFDNVGYDHMGVSEMAVKYLVQKGYREIGFVGGNNKMRPNIKHSRRLTGYLTAMEEMSLPVNENWVLNTGWSDEECVKLVSKLCKSGNLPQAFYAASDLMGIAVLEALHKYRISIPEKVAVIGVSDINIAKYSNPPLTTVALTTKEMGIEAADLLIRRILGERTVPRRVLFPYHLVERKST